MRARRSPARGCGAPMRHSPCGARRHRSMWPRRAKRWPQQVRSHDPEKWTPVFGQDHAQTKNRRMSEDTNFDALSPELASDETALIVDVEGFEGPLDLLLMLARQQKVDLSKISILALADQY